MQRNFRRSNSRSLFKSRAGIRSIDMNTLLPAEGRSDSPPSQRSCAGRLNDQVAARLREAADLLERQNAKVFRLAAYRRAADRIATLEEDVSALLDREGIAGLEALPGIGKALAAAIAQMVRTGRWAQLERLRGAVAPEQLFQSIPGIGPSLARRIYEHLGVDTLEGLETAAHDGRLDRVPGIGLRRLAMLRAALGQSLTRLRPPGKPATPEPSAKLLLEIDREYRERAQRDELPKIAPRRFNPSATAWLPILHSDREGWHFTALFSNTARAHELSRTRDWVVIYFYRNSRPEGQRTVVTESRGVLEGRRVIRGRESECLAQLQHATPRSAQESLPRGRVG